MKGIPEDLSENTQHYIKVWARALGAFLAWQEERVLQWAQQFYEALRTDENWFCREDEIRYILPLLIPEVLTEELSPEELDDLKRRLAISIHVGAVRFPPRITELNETLPTTPEAAREIGEFIRKSKAEGSWFSGSLDQYDWAAAKARIQAILEDYRARDRLPSLARDLFAPDAVIRECAAETLARMGRLAAPAKAGLIEVIRGFPHEKAALFAIDALLNLDDPSPEILDALSRAATSAEPSIRRKARYAHFALTFENRSWDDT